MPDELRLQDVASIASVAIAFLALLVSASNRNTARRALALTSDQEQRRKARLDLSLIDSLALEPSASDSGRWVAMNILAVNPTDRDGSLTHSELHLAYTLDSGQGLVVKVPHKNSGEGDLGITPLEIPQQIAANGAVSGWLLFYIPVGLLPTGVGVDRYDAAVTDSRGLTETISCSSLRKVHRG